VTVSETLGVVAHRGGLLVDRPELSVGVSLIVARPTGLEVRLGAQRPLRTGLPPAPRVLLPAYDEGVDLRVGWLDSDGRAHWEYGSISSYQGTYFEIRTTVQLPPMDDRLDLVLAWPEAGFPEAVIRLPLPSRAAVDRGSVSVWEAPPVATPAGVMALAAWELPDLPVQGDPDPPRIEAGRLAADPCVLVRGPDAVVTLTRVTRTGPILALEVQSIARGEAAARIDGVQEPQRTGFVEVTPGLSLLNGHAAAPLHATEGSYGGGPDRFVCEEEFAVPADRDVLDLLIGWPLAGIPTSRATIPLTRS
jgi:hypothetical protein